MVKTMPRVRTPLWYASCLAPCGKTYCLYFHYMYFNIARILDLQVDNVFGLFLLFPSIVAGTITLGLMTQITNVFGQVRGAFQYLINSWTTLVELMSIYKRLRSFEHERMVTKFRK